MRFVSLAALLASSMAATVVYGSTPAGVMAAVASGRLGVPTTLVSPTARIGGMTAGGLGKTDSGDGSVIGGFALEFFQRVDKVYDRPSGSFLVTPGVALQVFMDMLQDAGVVVTASTENMVASVSVVAGKVVSLKTVNGSIFTGASFIDASYEGDLLAAAGASFSIGREPAALYNESTNGRMVIPNGLGGDNHQFHEPVKYKDAAGNIVPMIYTGNIAGVGDGDGKVQAFNFRFCLTQNTSNMLPVPVPSSYNASEWALFQNYMMALNGTKTEMTDFLTRSMLPEGKTDINNNGPISTDLIGGSWYWPNGTVEERKAIYDAHKNYTLSFLHFLTTDASVPEQLRHEMTTWGLCADEFVDTGGWPPQLYVREGRRLKGDYIFTQHQRTTDLHHNDTVGLGSYNIDNHHTERFLQEHDNATWVLNEGNTQAFERIGPFELPYRLLTPKKSELENLLVPVAVSATHSGFGCIRLEPQWMILGQAAGVAAVHSAAAGVAVQDVNVTAVQTQLLKDGAKLTF